MSLKIQPVLIIHGGAGRAWKDSCPRARIRKKLARILDFSYKKLVKTNALEAVTYAVKLLEDDPEFNAGTGSQLQADGRARLSASLMDGARLRFAGVINLEQIKNPILVARRLLDEKDRVLASQGAIRFAKKLGMKSFDPRTRESILRWKRYRPPSSSPRSTGGGLRWGASYDTVGACALDRFGNLASATSTGGRGFERPGRVSDSAMPVANYADKRCAVSATGIGEEIIDEGLAIKIATRVEDGMKLSRAFEKTFKEIQSRGKRMGAIGIDRKGNLAHFTTTEVLLWAWQNGRMKMIF